MTTVLITGVTGFVGSTLVRYFSGHTAIQLIGSTRNVDEARIQFRDFNISIVSAKSTDQLDALEIDCIIHSAGIAHDLSNQYTESDYNTVNFEDTKRLYDNFLFSRATKFIYFSSVKAVADTITVPLDERVSPSPRTPYGKSKLKAEEYIITHALESKNYYILRPCMIHGPGNKGNLNLLYEFVKSGIPYPLGAFDNRRSFLGADNLSFIIDELVHNSISSGLYNIADDGSLSTTEIVTLIATTLGRKPRIWKLPASPIKFLSRIVGRKQMLDKLTENMEVSNQKILAAINKPLPVSIRNGLQKTIQSFS